LNPRSHEAQLEDPKAKKGSRRSSRIGKTAKANNRQEKRQSQVKWQRRARKSSEEQEKPKINTEDQKSKKSSKTTQKLKINTPPEINSP
jgi:hypothetical protein